MLSIRAYAKINLYLDVISRYPDGYHRIESIMQSISLYDRIEVAPAQDLQVTCTQETLSGEENLAFRAARLLRERQGIDAGAVINIVKRIPVAAGLAGGSADAAATLAALNTLWDLNLSLENLQEIGATLGADIPFCLAGGTMLAEGKGESLSRLQPMQKIPIVLVTPPIHVSTAEIYHAIDEECSAPIDTKDAVLEALSGGDAHRLAGSLKNLLESVALSRYPAIAKVKQFAQSLGGIGVLMSGSGPSVFILCEDESSARHIAGSIKAKEESFFVEIVQPVDHGVEFV